MNMLYCVTLDTVIDFVRVLAYQLLPSFNIGILIIVSTLEWFSGVLPDLPMVYFCIYNKIRIDRHEAGLTLIKKHTFSYHISFQIFTVSPCILIH